MKQANELTEIEPFINEDVLDITSKPKSQHTTNVSINTVLDEIRQALATLNTLAWNDNECDTCGITAGQEIHYQALKKAITALDKLNEQAHDKEG